MKDWRIKGALRRKLAALLIVVLVLGMMPGSGVAVLAEEEATGGSGENFIAQISKNGENTEKVHSLEEAFTEKNKDATITLLQNVELEKTLVVSNGAFTLDLSEYTITAKNLTVVLCENNAKLTIQGNGKIVSIRSDVESGGIEVTEDQVISNSNKCVGVKVTEGNLCVSDANVVITGDDIGLEVSGTTESTTVQLSGGTYNGTTAAIKIIDSELKISNLLYNNTNDMTKWYAYYDKNNSLIVDVLDKNELTNHTVMVRECTHEGDGISDYIKNSEDGTHQKKCKACGYLGESEQCSYEYTQGDSEEKHIATCKLCSNQKTEAHKIKYNVSPLTDENGITITGICETMCNYTKEVGTVIFRGDISVSYGEVEGKKLEVITTDAIQLDNIKWYKGLEETFIPEATGTSYILPALETGAYQYRFEATYKECPIALTTTVSVSAIVLSEEMIKVSSSSTIYNGNIQKPIVTVTQDNNLLDENTDYTISYDPNNFNFKDVGDVTIIITGKGNYTGEIRKDYTIEKARPQITWSNVKQEVVYNGKPAEITKPAVTLVDGGKFNGDIKYFHKTKDESEYKDNLPTNAGTYTIKAEIAETDNYIATASTIELIVEKAEKAPNIPRSIMKPAQSTLTVGDVQLPPSWKWIAGSESIELKDNIPVTATAIYNGSDKGNYKVEEVEITINRSSCNHSQTKIENKIEATCTSEGYSGDTICTECNEIVSQGEKIALAEHNGGTATCSKKKICDVCGQEYGEIDKDNHSNIEIKNQKEATCTFEGYSGDTFCKDCQIQIQSGNNIEALGHDETEKIIKEATVDSEGIKEFTCFRCNNVRTESIPKLSGGNPTNPITPTYPTGIHQHVYSSKITKDPSCTEKGIRTYSCPCGASYTEELASLDGHRYTSKVTKQPTATAEGIRTYTCDRCQSSYTEKIAKLDSEKEEKPDPSELTVSKTTLEKNALTMNTKLTVGQIGSKIYVAWGKVSGADGYDVYVQYCGKDFSSKPSSSIKGTERAKVAVSQIDGKKLDLKKNYKVYVAAYKLVGGEKVSLGKTITAHGIGRSNTTYTNAREIVLKKDSYSLKSGGTATISASTVLDDKNKKQLSDAHAKEFRYASSNKKVATVSAAGKIKAVGEGSCTIYVYSRNGYAETIKVTVK